MANRNQNSKYSQRKRRNEALYKYKTGTQEYRDEIDNIGCIFWSIVTVFIVIIFFIIAFTKGSDEAIKWLK